MHRRSVELLGLRAEHRFLDLGCGWGSLSAHVAEHVGANCTAWTNHEGQADHVQTRLRKIGATDRSKVLCADYRTSEGGKFDRIACIEMAEHVGVKNLRTLFDRIGELLSDDGRVLLQWTGLRRALKAEDLIWGLFVSKYIFPGADGALPLSSMLKVAEKAGFEVHAVTNVSTHYEHTLLAWRANWRPNRADLLARFGERTYRVWAFFLAWSAMIARQGSACSYQVVLTKNDSTIARQLEGA
jgi:cyclopropane fatty-acyl-phospholipid synthase-like methyltransferase